MITENLSTLKIHKLTQAQYERERDTGNLDENALYLTPDEEGTSDNSIHYCTDTKIYDTDDSDGSIAAAGSYTWTHGWDSPYFPYGTPKVNDFFVTVSKFLCRVTNVYTIEDPDMSMDCVDFDVIANLNGDNSEIDLSVYATKDDVENIEFPVYAAEESVDAPAEVINADTLGGYNASDFRHSDWLPTSEEVGAAPAGWGYGGAMDYIVDESGTFETKLNEIMAGMVNHSVKQFSFYDTKGLTSKKFFGTLWRYTNQYAALEAINYDGNKAIKCMYGGVWNPWEWVNPPMAVGVEYRTTERFAGAPVYCGVISYTNAATIGGSGSNVVIEIPHPFIGLSKPVRVTGRQDGVYPVPNITSGGNTYAITRIDSNSIDLRLNGCTFDSRTWYFTIYYIK